MRVLQVSSAKDFGGGERHLVDLCCGLFENSHMVFAALRKENDWRQRLEFLEKKNVFQLPLKNSLDVFSARKLAGIMRENEIDIIHAHLARDYPIASLAQRLCPEAKLVLTRHVLFPMKSIHKLTLGNVSKVIAVSTAVEANLRKTFPAEKIVCIPNGIETGKFAKLDREKLNKEFRASHSIPLNTKLIGTIGELKKLKGQEDFVLAANEIAKNISDVHFIVVGVDNSFDQSFRRKLKRLVKVFDLEDKFTFLDWVEDTMPLLSAFDIFVSPSHSESFGLAILEAMASGNIVISTETEGAKELIKNDFSGKIVSVEKPVELAEAVYETMENPEKSALFGKNAQKHARDNFDLEKMISKTENLYKQTIS